MSSIFAPPPLSINRLGTVSTVLVEAAPDTTTLPLPTANTLDLPLQCFYGNDWRLSHASPSTGEVVEWNWTYQPWFSNGASLSSYKLLDKQLLDTLAGVFTRLQLVHSESVQGCYEEYTVFAAQENPRIPNVLYYTNLTGSEQYLALYNRQTAYAATGDSEAASITIYEIVQVELNAEFLHRRLRAAQQAAIHENRRLLG